MNRRFLLAALCAAPLVAIGGPAFAQQSVIDGINEYLTNLQSATARFTQKSAGGGSVSGTFYMQKPGKMRFEYDPPFPALIVADGFTLAIFDLKSNRGPQRYPQSSTPLSLLTRQNVSVTQSKFVRMIETKGGRIHVTMFDPKAPKNGTMRMIFSRYPIELVEWVIVDSSGAESIVELEKLDKNTELNSRLFSIPHTIADLKAGN